MLYLIYADLSRLLTNIERTELLVVLDALIDNSGCIGPQRFPSDEIYFTLEASTETEARTSASILLNSMLSKANIEAEFSFQVVPGRS